MRVRQDDTWVIEFESSGGSVTKHSISESRIPKYIHDRKFSGEFGNWLLKKFFPDKYSDAGYRTSWHILQIYRN